MIYIGIDPGKNGAIAKITGRSVETYRFKNLTYREIRDALHTAIGETEGRIFILFEKAFGLPRQSAPNAYTYGEHNGVLKGVLIELSTTRFGLQWDEVRPSVWKKAMGVATSRNVLYRDKKKVSRKKAQDLFPRIDKIDDSIAEALLIAEYCRRFYGRT